jgi:hypothetical protein
MNSQHGLAPQAAGCSSLVGLLPGYTTRSKLGVVDRSPLCVIILKALRCPDGTVSCEPSQSRHRGVMESKPPRNVRERVAADD